MATSRRIPRKRCGIPSLPGWVAGTDVVWIIIGLSAAATIALAVTLGINYFSTEIPAETGISEVDITDTGGSSNQGGKLEERVFQTFEEIAREETMENEQ